MSTPSVTMAKLRNWFRWSLLTKRGRFHYANRKAIKHLDALIEEHDAGYLLDDFLQEALDSVLERVTQEGTEFQFLAEMGVDLDQVEQEILSKVDHTFRWVGNDYVGSWRRA